MSDPFNDYPAAGADYDSEAKTLGCSVPVLAFLATFFGWVGGIIIFVLEKQNIYVRAVALHCFIVTLPVFVLLVLLLLLVWVDVFLIIFWIVFVVWVVLILVLTGLAVYNAKSGIFLGFPFLDQFVLKYANR